MEAEAEFRVKIQKIVHFFQRTKDSGFLFCVCDSPRFIRDIIQPTIYREAEARGLMLRDVYLTSDNVDNFIQRIREKVDRKPGGLLIMNFSELVRISEGNALREINFARELLIALKTPMLFWLNSETASRFANEASDFFLRRDRSLIEFSTDIELTALSEERRRILSAIEQQKKPPGDLPKDVIDITLDALGRRLDEVNNQIESMRNAGMFAEGKGILAVGEGKTQFLGNNHRIDPEEDPLKEDPLKENPNDPESALRLYLKGVVNQNRYLPLLAIDPLAGDPRKNQHRMDLTKIYVGMDTNTPLSRIIFAENDPLTFERRFLKVLSASEAVARNRYAVILSDPGGGKSTFLYHMAFCFASHLLEPEAGWLERVNGWEDANADHIPIFVILRDFAGWLLENETKNDQDLLWKFIVHRLKSQHLAAAAKPLHDSLRAGRALLLLDGFDEIPEDRVRIRVKKSVEEFADRYSKTRIIATCRLLFYQNPKWKFCDFPTFELAPFDKKQISAFVSAWYKEMFRLGEIKTEMEAHHVAEQLKTALRQPDLMRFARNPLLLTVMALIHIHRGHLPESRAMLYEESVDILLWRWDEHKAAGERTLPRLRELLQDAGRSRTDLKIMLWKLAFEAQEAVHILPRGDGLTDIKEWKLSQALAELHPTKSLNWAHQVVDAIKMRSGLLLEHEPGIYSFPHRTFQEYLAGAHLSNRSNFADRCVRLAEEGPYWRETILLAVGRLVHIVGVFDKALDLVSKLCPISSEDHELEWRKSWIAGEVLLEMGFNRVRDLESGRNRMERVRSRLSELLKLGRLNTMERVKAGDALGRLGDPRFRPDAWHLPNEAFLGFSEVPAGPFLMGSDEKKDSEAYEGEMPQHRVELPNYFISRYPVTVAQFRTYLENTGLQYSSNLNITDNHPITNVSFHDAVRYCEWLTDQLREWSKTPEPFLQLLKEKKWRIRLPSEAEWEKAARGKDGRTYPWGYEEETIRANFRRTRIHDTSPVGCFPRGKSPFGCLDMAGNVLEWTRSLWGKDWKVPDFKYPYDPKDRNREDEAAEDQMARVLRGGSFEDSVCDIRCAGRLGLFPNTRDRNIGFRCVCAPSGTGI